MHLQVEQKAKRIPAAAPPVPYRDIVREYVLLTTSVRNIHVWEVCAVTALSPVVYSGQTAKVNFISGNTIGCAYPSLTLARETCWGYGPSIAGNDRSLWVELGFTPLLSTVSPQTMGPVPLRCARQRFLCLSQRRRFSDDGAVTFQFGQRTTDDDYRALSVSWRVRTRGDCPAGCKMYDR